MVLEVYAAHSGALQESSPCTPDGNCFVVVYNLDQFILRLSGPQGAVFAPSEYNIDIKDGGSCDDL